MKFLVNMKEKEMAISFVRVDERIIHSQIVTAWSKQFPCDGIVVIDDEILKSPILTSVFKMAAPAGVKVHILDVKTAVGALPEITASNQKYFIIVKTPMTFKRLVEKGGDLSNENENRINIGPIHQKSGSRVIAPNIAITSEEEEALDFLSDKFELEFRLLPGSRVYFWEEAR